MEAIPLHAVSAPFASNHRLVLISWEVGHCLNPRNALPLNNTWPKTDRIWRQLKEARSPYLERAPLRLLPKMNWCASNKPDLLRHLPLSHHSWQAMTSSQKRRQRRRGKRAKSKSSNLRRRQRAPRRQSLLRTNLRRLAHPSPLRQPLLLQVG